MSKFSAALSSVSYSAAVKASQSISSSVQELAANSGWPEGIVNQLSVIVKEGQLIVNYPASISKEIQDLEYGTEVHPPKPVLRKFEYMLPDLLQPYLEKELDSRMSEVVSSL